MVHEHAAGFVLDSLDAEEVQEFERHLHMCPACEEELEPLRVAAAALAFAGDLPPPRPALRGRVLANAVVLRFRRRWPAPVVSAAALAACAAIAVGLAGQGQASGRSLVVDGRGLPAAPPGKVYEIWLVRNGHASPAGFLHGRTARLSHLPRGAVVAVTLEPAGGSRRPTGALLLRTETA